MSDMTKLSILRLPIKVYILLGMAVYTLVLSILGIASAWPYRNTASLNVLLVWSSQKNCYMVDIITPPSWLASTEDLLQPGDCIEQIGNVPWWDKPRIQALLNQYADTPAAKRFVPVNIRRGDQQFWVDVPVQRLTLYRLLQFQLPLIIIGVGFWALGLITLLAQPTAESNRIFAATAFLATLFSIANYHMFEPEIGIIYTMLTMIPVLAFLGATRFHLGLIMPQRPVNPRYYRLRFLLYPLAFLDLLLHEIVMVYVRSGAAWIPPATTIALALALILMVVGELMFLGRICSFLRVSSLRLRRQARILVLAWSFGWLPLLTVLIGYWFTIIPLFSHAPILKVIFCPIIAVSGTAYAMLRYQTFSSRGTVLTGLTVIFISAALAFYCTMLLPARVLDGIQFCIVWGSTILTTLFWYVKSPAREAFKRLFLRDHYHYAVALGFTQHMIWDMPTARTTRSNIERALRTAIQYIYEKLEVEWVALQCNYYHATIWLKTGAGTTVHHIGADAALPYRFPTAPAYTESLTNTQDTIGMLWLGPRITAEPLDEDDSKLIRLLAQQLAHILTIYEYLDQLASVPRQILAAEDRAMNRVSEELHDSALGFLGGLSLNLATAREQIYSSPAQAATILTCSEEEVPRVSDLLRTLVFRLRLPVLKGKDFLTRTQGYLDWMCMAQGIEVIWEVLPDEDCWKQLADEQVTQLYRIIQAAVDNAVRHAAPSMVGVRFERQAIAMEVTIWDNGKGIEGTTDQIHPAHFGLVNMRDRAGSLGGSCRIIRREEGGTAVIIHIPLLLDREVLHGSRTESMQSRDAAGKRTERPVSLQPRRHHLIISIIAGFVFLGSCVLITEPTGTWLAARPPVVSIADLAPLCSVETQGNGTTELIHPLLFRTDRDGDQEIYIMDSDGLNLRNLTRHPADETDAVWSPNGRCIAFTSDRDNNTEIYLTPADGNTAINLTHHPDSDWGPVWSPDGRSIVFNSDRDGNTEVYHIHIDGTDPKNLTQHTASDDEPAIAPDGRKIVFSSNRDGPRTIYLMSQDGSNQHPLKLEDIDAWSPTWSPDGSTIAFEMWQNGYSDIATIRPDGTQLQNLTHDLSNDHIGPAAYSSDGQYLAFNSERDGNVEIYIMNADGTNPRRLTINAANDWTVGWGSP